jgi:hypothetical protein
MKTSALRHPKPFAPPGIWGKRGPTLTQNGRAGKGVSQFSSKKRKVLIMTIKNHINFSIINKYRKYKLFINYFGEP